MWLFLLKTFILKIICNQSIIIFTIILISFACKTNKQNLILKSESEFIQQTDSSLILQFYYDTSFSKYHKLLAKPRRSAHFLLKGKHNSQYIIENINDTLSIIYRLKKKNYFFIDSIIHQDCSFECEQLVPSFTIHDFNKDGNQDLSCWAYSNINGNQWTYIYLFNDKKNRLVSLLNTSETRLGLGFPNKI